MFAFSATVTAMFPTAIPACLRLSPARGLAYSSLRSLFIHLKSVRSYSQVLPSFPRQQPWPGAQFCRRGHDLVSEPVRLNGPLHDAGSSSAGSPPPSPPSSPDGDNPNSPDRLLHPQTLPPYLQPPFPVNPSPKFTHKYSPFP